MHALHRRALHGGLPGRLLLTHRRAGGPEENHSVEEFRKYGRNRIAEGKLPACAEMCSTKALLAGDAPVITTIYKTRVVTRGKGDQIWGWAMAYGGSDKLQDQPGVKS